MDSFDENINRTDCLNMLKHNQSVLIKEYRQIFNNMLLDEINKCSRSVFLPFDERLWNEGKKIITEELINRFIEIKLKRKQNSKVEVTMSITKDDISNIEFSNINGILIEFF